jgi:hypothetical protein
MTHTLHRRGTNENLQDDFIVFAMSAKGINDNGSAAKMKEFFNIVKRHKPVNMGDMKTGNWTLVDEKIIEEKIQDTSIVHSVFSDIETVSNVLKDLQEADLGLSVVISGLTGPVKQTCRKLGVNPAPHTIEYSLGIWGKTDLLPRDEILEISTMCGHGQVAFHLIEKMVADIKRGVTTPEKAAKELAEPCVCGIFNPIRATKLLRLLAKE